MESRLDAMDVFIDNAREFRHRFISTYERDKIHVGGCQPFDLDHCWKSVRLRGQLHSGCDSEVDAMPSVVSLYGLEPKMD
jgi:hypothetical protein